jgi:hypothetical protein
MLASLVLLVLVSCGPRPLQRTDIAPLERIRIDYEHLVRDALASDDTRWHSGWVGNWIVNWRNSEASRGLCYHWQELVYKGIQPVADEVGWARVGIQMNKDHHSEHHAVVVYDPRVITQDDLLSSAQPRPAYVLDAWRHGQPEIYALDDWVKGSGWTRVWMVVLEDLDREYAERDAELEVEEDPRDASAFEVKAEIQTESEGGSEVLEEELSSQ